ncbi:MAG: class I SAM-dependent methyltransferase, partial [Leptospira sp.]|nr:class I SAM-dependent methyltransferase [Leptospira sp.]
MKNIEILVSNEIYKQVEETQGIFFESISYIDRKKIAADLLNPNKSKLQADILEKFILLKQKKILEVGSGLGLNLLYWKKYYDIDPYGLEPDGEGFSSSHKISKMILKENGLDPKRIIDSFGEEIPFENNTFDVVYSTNVLEHVNEPEKVLSEILRVLKPGGIAQVIFPSYHSFFDGHYAVFHPPVLWKSFFPWYVKWIWRRDPDFAHTLRTELNYFSTKKMLKRINNSYPLEILSFGEEVFYERMSNLNFEDWAGLGKIK